MSISPKMDLSPDPGGMDSIRMNLNDDFTELYQEKNDSSPEKLPVFIRIRPMLPQEQTLGYDNCLKILQSSIVRATAPIDSARFRNMEKILDFTFTHVFSSDVSQLSFFEETMNHTVKDFIGGQNTLLFAYGSSGSGKTYTMLGNDTKPGIIPLTIQLFFQCVQGKQVPSVSFRPHNACEIIQLDQSEIAEQHFEKEKLLTSYNEEMDSTKASCSSISLFNTTRISDSVLQDLSTLPSFAQFESSCQNCLDFQGDCYYSCWVSFLELYNEQIYDLFKPFSKNKRQALGLGEDQNGNIFVKGLKEIHVSSISEVLKLLHLGQRNLNIATTKLNYQSSRSHCIFNIKVIRMTELKSPSKVFINTLSFCDLAGSERCGKTQNTGIRLKEASNINASLMVLARCIEVLRLNQTLKEKKLVPFRESKLTRLFSNFFIGKGKASMIVNVSPSSHTFDETSNVLKFSALAQQVSMKENSYGKDVSRLTDLLNSSRLSTSSTNRDSMSDPFGDSFLLESREETLKELMNLADILEKELRREKAEKSAMESKLRSELRGEFMEYFVESRKFYEKRFQDMQKNIDKKDERRFKTLFENLRSDSTKDSRSSEEEEDDGEENIFNVDKHSDDQYESGHSTRKDNETSSFDCVRREILALKTKLKQQEVDLEASEKSLDKANSMISFKDKAIEKCNYQLSKFKESISILEELVKTKSTQVEELQEMESQRIVEFETFECERISLQEALTKMKNDLTTLQNEVGKNQTLRFRITELEENLTQQENLVSNQRNTIKNFEASAIEKQEDMKESAKKAADLEQHIKVLDDQLEDVKVNNKNLKEALKMINEECLQKKENIFSLETTTKSLNEQLTEQKHLSQKLENDINAHVIELKIKNETIESSSKKINSLEVKIRETDEMLNQMKSKMAANCQELSKLEEQHEQAQSLLQTKEAELVTSLEKIELYKTRISENEEERLSTEQRLLELQNVLSSTESQLKMLNVPIESTSQQTDPMHYDAQISNLQEMLGAMEEKLKENENHLNKLNSEMIVKSEELLKSEVKHVEWQSTLQSKEDELSEKKNILAQLKTEMTAKSQELSNMERKCNEWQLVIQTKDSELYSKDSIIKQVKEELLSSNDSLTKERENISQLQKAISLKNAQLTEKEETLKTTSESLSLHAEELSKKCSEFQEIATSKESEVEKQTAVITMLNNQIQSLNATVSEHETNLSKTAEILLQKQNKIDSLSEKISQLEVQKEMSAVEPEEMNKTKLDQSLKKTAEEDVIIIGDDSDDNDIEIISTGLINHNSMEDESNNNQEILDTEVSTLTLLQVTQATEYVATERVLNLIKINNDLKNQNEQLSNNIYDGMIKIDELQELVNLLQKIECVATKNFDGRKEIDERKIKRISELIVKNAKLATHHNELKSKLQDCDRMITAKDTSIKDLEKALHDQKEIEQAERDMCKNQYETQIQKLEILKNNLEQENKKLEVEKSKVEQYETQIQKLETLKNNLEQENKKLEVEISKVEQYEADLQKLKTMKEALEEDSKKLKEKLKFKPESELEESKTEKEASEKENEKSKEEIKPKEKPESEEKEQFLKPRIGRPSTRSKISLENSNRTAADDSVNQSGLAVSVSSFHLKGTRSRGKSSIDVKDKVVETSPPSQVSSPRVNQRRKKTFSHDDISKDILANGDSELTTKSIENESPKPKLRGKRKSSSFDSSKDMLANSDSETKTKSVENESPKPKLRGKRKSSSFDSSKDILANGDSEPKNINESPKPKLRGKRKSSSFDQSSSKENAIEIDSELKNDEIAEDPPLKRKQGRSKKKIIAFEQSKDNSDVDFEELPKRKTSSRSTRSSSALLTEEAKQPLRPTRVTRKKSMRVIEDEEPKPVLPTRATRGKALIEESPLSKIRNFVNEAVPKIKSAAEHVSSMLSPVIARKEIPPPSTRKKRKLFTDDCQPILAVLSPVQKEKELIERKTRSRQSKRIKK